MMSTTTTTTTSRNKNRQRSGLLKAVMLLSVRITAAMLFFGVVVRTVSFVLGTITHLSRDGSSSELSSSSWVLPVKTESESLLRGSSTSPGDVVDDYDLDLSMTDSEQAEVRDHWAFLSGPEIYQNVRPWTMVSEQRVLVLEEYITKINERNVSGNIVECGVWQGGSAMAMILFNLRNNTDREFFLFDTFEGMPRPVEQDGGGVRRRYDKIQAGKIPRKYIPRKGYHGKPSVIMGKWNYGPLSVVKNNMLHTGYPSDKIHLAKGMVEDTLPKVVGRIKANSIALLRLDTDFYSSTKIELELLYDLLVPGGLLWIDDYCDFEGSRKATDEFFNARGLNATDLGATKGSLCGYFFKPPL